MRIFNWFNKKYSEDELNEKIENEIGLKLIEIDSLRSKNTELLNTLDSKKREHSILLEKLREQNESDLLFISEKICREIKEGKKREDIQVLINQQSSLLQQQSYYAQQQGIFRNSLANTLSGLSGYCENILGK